MLATIILSLTIGIAFITQTLNRVRCRSIECINTTQQQRTELAPRPTLVLPRTSAL